MLANGITLAISETLGGAGQYKVLAGLKEVPEIGSNPEKVENTTLADTVKQYEPGIGDPGELEYKFKYENTEDSSYRLLRKHANQKKVLAFKQTLADKTEISFEAIPVIKLGGGGVNAVIDFTLSVMLQSDITFKDPVA